MSPLAERIARTIREEGPIDLDRFWTMALFDPADGYYTRRLPFGRAGDFVTAPEISQMFGELLGAWLVAAWRALGRPRPFLLCEIGPGRGTLIADVVRTTRKLDPSFMAAARIRLVETSDRLAALQLEALGPFDLPVRRVRRLESVEDGPLLLLANELFDAVAIQQFTFRDGSWRERLVGGDAGGFVFAEGPPAAPPSGLPGAPFDGAVLEIAPQRLAIAGTIGARIAHNGGAGLLVDYGHAASAYGDTLQALRGHRFAEVLADPGAQDITSHVDFEALARALGAAGAIVSPVVEQGAFLAALGLLERGAILAAGETGERRGTADAATRRLAGSGEGEMGRLFKVLAVASQPLPLPPFVTA